MTEQTRDGHAVEHSAFGGLRRVGIHMRVDPKQSDLAALFSGSGMCDAFPGSDRAGVIAAHHDRQLAVLDDPLDASGQPCAYFPHRFQGVFPNRVRAAAKSAGLHAVRQRPPHSRYRARRSRTQLR
jgi:hypothetical protein